VAALNMAGNDMARSRRKCTAKTKTGLACSGWAMADSDHCRRHRTDLAPYRPGGTRTPLPENRSHGLYSRFLTANDAAEMALVGGSVTLDDEIAFTRVVIRRLADLVDSTESIDDACKLANTLFAGTGRVANLLRTQQTISRDNAGGHALMGVIADALEEVGDEWGIDL